MSSFYDLASLVMIPSGKKAGKVYSQKPLSTNGQLDFTRASTATRIGSNGLIEKTRTNLLLQSNSFNTTWTNTRSAETSGQTDPNGGTTAWKISESVNTSGSLANIGQSVSANIFSFYAKADEISQILIYLGTSRGAYFNLTDGSFVGYYSGSFTDILYNSTNVGGGWYRYSVFWTGMLTAEVYTAIGGNIIHNLNTGDGFYLWRAQAEYGLVATDYIPTTTAAVSVGSVNNMPRLNYTPGSATSCPSLLLEPQRTNLIPQSEYFAGTDYKKNSFACLQNHDISPEGLKNASLIYQTANGDRDFYINTANQIEVFSVYAKAAGKDFFAIFDKAGGNSAYYNLSNGTLGTVPSGTTATITAVGNNWYYLTYYRNQAGPYQFFKPVDANGSPNGTASGTDGALIYGAQLEAASYATSYIPSYGSTVTRTQDICNKASISGLIGQTEGTLFVEIDYTPHSFNYESLISLQGSSTQQYAECFFSQPNKINVGIYNGGSAQLSFQSNVLSAGIKKIAIAYKANDFAIYLNGAQVHTDNSGSVPLLSNIALGMNYAGSNFQLSQPLKKSLVFKTRLSNTQLADLTSIDS